MELGLDYKTITRLPDTIEFNRVGRTIQARRAQLGAAVVADRTLRIADVMYEGAESEQQPRLPIRPPNGSYTAYAYQWDHPDGAINVCVVVAFRAQSWSV